MKMKTRYLSRVRFVGLCLSAVLILGSLGISYVAGPVGADNYVPINGAGSTWSYNALNQWVTDESQYGLTVNYAGTGSSDGRAQFLAGTVDFAASDIPFQTHPTDGSNPENPAPGTFAYIPVTAGGTSFMYHLTINGQQVTNLRLSGENVAKIFTGVLTKWNDPAIQADNPNLTMPDETITPVVRSDGSGSTAQLSLWLISQHSDLWNAYCKATGRSGECGETSLYPTVNGMIAQSGDLGVAAAVTAGYGEGTIGYVQYSYALNAKYPVVKVLNAAGYYTEPTPSNVAVSLLKAQVETTNTDPQFYLTQKLDGVYTDTDPRTYPLSSYSYMILPTQVRSGTSFSTSKGKTLAAFSYYAMCQGQAESANLGYSPMPYNLVNDSFDQIKKIPGEAVPSFDLGSCHNPTIDTTNPSDPNLLATTAPFPQGCDKQGSTQCADGTGGAKVPTAASGGSAGPGGSAGSSSASSSDQASGGGPASGGGSSGGSSGTGSTGRTAAAALGVKGSVGAGGRSSSSGALGPKLGTGSRSSLSGSGTCDPSSGSCGSVTNLAAGVGSADASGFVDQSGPSVTATTLAVAHGWTATQTLMALIGLLLLGLVLAPGVASMLITKPQE